MKSKLPVCFCISLALREMTTSSAPSRKANDQSPDIYSFCPAIANCQQRKQRRVLVHTQFFSPRPAIRSLEQDICVVCAHQAARIV